MRYPHALEDLTEDVAIESAKMHFGRQIAAHKILLKAEHNFLRYAESVSYASPSKTLVSESEGEIDRYTALLNATKHPWLEWEPEDRFIRSCYTFVAAEHAKATMRNNILFRQAKDIRELCLRLCVNMLHVVPYIGPPAFMVEKLVQYTRVRGVRKILHNLEELYAKEIVTFHRENPAVAELYMADAGLL